MKDRTRISLLGVLAWSTLASCALAIVCYLRVSTYTRFLADDFCGAADYQQMGIAASLKEYYLTWDGRIASDLFNLAAQGAGQRWTSVLPAITIILWGAILVLVLRESFRKAGLEKIAIVSAAATVFLIYVTLRTAPNTDQSFFWETGLIVYGVPLLFLSGYMFCIFRALTGGKLWLAAGAVLTFMAGACSETYSAMQLTALLMAWLLWRFVERDDRAKVLVPGVLAAALSLAIVATAPGNAERQKTFILYRPDILRQFADSVLWAFYQGYRFVWQHPVEFSLCLLLPAIVAMHLRLPVHQHPNVTGNLRRLLLWNVAAFVVVLSSIAPAYFVSGAHPPDRAMVTTQFFLICVACAWGFIFGRALVQSKPRWTTGALVTAIVLLLCGPVLTAKNVWREAAVYRVYAELWDEQDAALRSAKQKGEKAVVLRKLPQWGGPGMESAGADPKAGFNVCIARYYGVESVSYREGP